MLYSTSLNQNRISLEFKVSHDPGIVSYPVGHLQSCSLRITQLSPSPRLADNPTNFICNNKIFCKSIPFAYKNGRHFRKSKPEPQIPPGFAFSIPIRWHLEGRQSTDMQADGVPIVTP